MGHITRLVPVSNLRVDMDWSTVNETLSQAAGKAQQDDQVSLRSFILSLSVGGGMFLAAAVGFGFLHNRFPHI